MPNPEYNDAARGATTVTAALEMQAHSAPLGIAFLAHATLLPAGYRGDLLVAYHGSWNRDTPTGAKVVRVHVSNGKPAGVEDFITGWQPANGRRWGRPGEVLDPADGAVLIADGFGVHVPKGYIYAAMAFSAGVEGLNMFARRRREKAAR